MKNILINLKLFFYVIMNFSRIIIEIFLQNGEKMIEIKNVTKKYGNNIALNNISFNVNNGEIFAFIGHNGAGKTTLIKSIVGIHEFDEGDILINGKSIKEKPVECKKNCSNFI